MTDPPTALLLRLALREIADEDPGRPSPSLVALHRRPTHQVFDAAADLLVDDDPARRELGVRILRELGDEQPGGRPFRASTVPVLHAMLRDETDPGVLRWIVSALGYHAVRPARPEVAALAGHPDVRVRFHVAAALPALADPAGIEPDAADALIRLCRDAEPDIRWYALYAVLHEVAGLPPEVLGRLVAAGRADPDGQIRSLAAGAGW